MRQISECRIGLCDNMNPSIGYQIRIVDSEGKDILFASRDPVDGKDLLTYNDALRVAGYYAEPSSGRVSLGCPRCLAKPGEVHLRYCKA